MLSKYQKRNLDSVLLLLLLVFFKKSRAEHERKENLDNILLRDNIDLPKNKNVAMKTK